MKIKFILIIGVFFCTLQLIAQQKIQNANGHFGKFILEISPDDKTVATAGYDGKIIFTNPHTGKIIKCLNTSSPVLSICWSNDNNQLFFTSNDSILKVVDVRTFLISNKFKLNALPLNIKYNPKHKVIAIALSNNKLIIIDEITGDIYFELEPGKNINAIDFSSNGALLFVATEQNGITAFELNQGKQMLSIPITKNKYAVGFQIANNSQLLLIHISDGSTELFDIFKTKSIGSYQNKYSSGLYYSNGFCYLTTTNNGQYFISKDDNNNFVFSNTSNNVNLTYNNSFSKASIEAIIPSHNNDYFIFIDANGAIVTVYFNNESFVKEKTILWKKLYYPSDRILNITYSPNDEQISMFGKGYYTFNLATGDLYRRDDDSLKISQSDYFTRYFITNKNKNTYYYTDMIQHAGYEIRNDTPYPLLSFAYSNDTNYIAFINDNNVFTVYDFINKKITKEETIKNPGQFVLFNGSLNNYFIVQNQSSLILIEQKTNKETIIKLPFNNQIANIDCDIKMTKMFLMDTNGKLYCYDMSKKEFITLPFINDQIQLFDLSDDGSKLSTFNNGKILVYDLTDKTKSFELHADEKYALTLCFNHNSNQLFVSGIDGVAEVFNLQSKEKALNLIASLNDGLIVYTNENYFMATKEAARHLTIEGNNSNLASFDLKYNRPDMVLKNTGKANAKIIKAYENAYAVRVKKYNVLNNSNAPEISLVDANNIPAKTENNTIDFKIKTSEKNVQIKTWINDVPVKNTSKRNENSTDFNIAIKLMSGTNTIKVACIDNNGSESSKEEFTITNTQNTLPDLYVLTIGTSEYADKNFNLNYAAKDATDIAALFKNEEIKNKPFGNIYVKTITNKEVTKENIFKSKDFVTKAGTNDMILIFIAGHGVRDENMNYYFGTSNMDFNNPAQKGFSEQDLTKMLEDVDAIRRLIFFDTCLSGEVDKSEAELTKEEVKTNDELAFRAAGAGLRSKAIGIDNANALMRDIYMNLNEGTGATIVSSAGGAEYAIESKEWKNGLFTYCFIKGLKEKLADANKDNEITMGELQNYIRKQVNKLSHGKQHPSFKNENNYMTYRIW